MARTFKNFDEFWPYYLKAHSNPTTRGFHYAGNAAAIAVAAVGLILVQHPGMLLAGLAAGYLLAWIGHFGFEKNRPATFTNPIWSFHGDLRMMKLWLLGRLSAELQKLGIR